jgi:hypothetical protein
LYLHGTVLNWRFLSQHLGIECRKWIAEKLKIMPVDAQRDFSIHRHDF